MGTPSATPSREGGLSKGEKDAAIAVPVIVGCLLAACKRRAPQPGLNVMRSLDTLHMLQ